MSSEYNHEQTPFIIREGALDGWPSAQWSLVEWADKCGMTKFKFRVHQRKKRDQVAWESEADSYVEATVAHLLAHVQCDRSTSSTELNDANPFEPFPIGEYCFYSGYNYMNKLAEPRPALHDSVRWRDTGLGEEKLTNDASNSTLWLGTSGSYTPCHMDTYGYNFVAQLYGRKLWILFPPDDNVKLYPTRIPFEESSIFSQVNFQCIDLHQFPLLRHTRPRIVELKAGEILFVPRHWWHFVQNVSGAGDDSISISINTWITGDERQNSLSESVVQFLARPLLSSYGETSWLNLNADLFTCEEAGHVLKLLLNGNVQAEQLQEQHQEEPEKETKRLKAISRYYLEESSFEDIALVQQNLKPIQEDAKPLRRRRVDLKDIVNCILDPEVIDLIKSKLEQCAALPVDPD